MNKKWLVLIMSVFLSVFVSFVGAQTSDDDFSDDEFSEESDEKGFFKGIEFTGFLELEQGLNISGKGPHRQGPKEDHLDWITANRRFRLNASKVGEKGGMYAKIDFNYDDVYNKTYFDVRELRVQYRLFSWMDISIGRQVSTWGVGDMVFINDLFPKNWNANFSGRSMEYMKDPSTSLRVTSYFGKFSLDIVYHPKFTPDTTPTGRYFSVYDPNSRMLIANPTGPFPRDKQDHIGNSTESGELAASLKTRIGSQQVALYGYTGFYKNPKGIMIFNNMLMPFYPKLSVFGASSEGQIGPGIFTAEVGYYYSREDKDGNNPMIENSMFKWLAGYRMDLSSKLSAGIQWYQERMMDYDAYKESMAKNPFRKKEVQNTYTLRLTFKTQQDTLWVSLFSYYRPEDKDSFTRLDITKQLDTNFSVTLGAAIFTGKDNYEDREFGMLRHDDNIFMRLKYNF